MAQHPTLYPLAPISVLPSTSTPFSRQNHKRGRAGHTAGNKTDKSLPSQSRQPTKESRHEQLVTRCQDKPEKSRGIVRRYENWAERPRDGFSSRPIQLLGWDGWELLTKRTQLDGRKAKPTLGFPDHSVMLPWSFLSHILHGDKNLSILQIPLMSTDNSLPRQRRN